MGWKEIDRMRDVNGRMMRLKKETKGILYEFDVDENGVLLPHPQDDKGMISVFIDPEGKNILIRCSSLISEELKEQICTRLEKEAHRVAKKIFSLKKPKVVFEDF